MRDESGTFLVEGLHLVGSALEAGWEIETLFYAPDVLTGNFANTLLETARRRGCALRSVSADVINAITEKENPQGILAVVKQKPANLSDLQDFHCGAALVSPQDPGNVGTILRTLDAVGADSLFLLDGGVELYHPTVVRASMGALFWKPVVQAGFEEFAGWAKEINCQMIGSSAHAGQDYRDYHSKGFPWVLVLGNEQKGLSTEYVGLCDITLALPMRGRASSLNLSVAAGVLLYALIT